MMRMIEMTYVESLAIGPSPCAPIKKIQQIQAEFMLNQSHCETIIHVGMFFDGTNNNVERDLPINAHSNIARLWAAYPDYPNIGVFSQYIPGVGTKFPEI